MNRSFVGILVSDTLYRNIPFGKTGYESMELYEEAAAELGFRVCFVRLKDLIPKQKKISALVKVAGTYTKQWIPTPVVIHNRAIYAGVLSKRKLNAWAVDGRTIFNGWNRYGKLKIHDLLMLDESLRAHLPATSRATLLNLQAMMGEFESLIIKPNKSSVGRGIMKMDRTDTGWRLQYPHSFDANNKKWRTRNMATRIPHFLIQTIQKKFYILQQRLPLATFHGRPFDLRVSVQRGNNGTWQLTGIVGKVASKKSFLTNVAQGASVLTLEEIISQYPELQINQVREDITSFSLRIAEHLSLHVDHLADIGLDVGLTDAGFPMLIEVNSKDQRYAFKKAGLLHEWKMTYRNPMLYAKYLLEQKGR